MHPIPPLRSSRKNNIQGKEIMFCFCHAVPYQRTRLSDTQPVCRANGNPILLERLETKSSRQRRNNKLLFSWTMVLIYYSEVIKNYFLLLSSYWKKKCKITEQMYLVVSVCCDIYNTVAIYESLCALHCCRTPHISQDSAKFLYYFSF